MNEVQPRADEQKEFTAQATTAQVIKDAAENYLHKWDDNGIPTTSYTWDDMAECFKAGAEWQDRYYNWARDLVKVALKKPEEAIPLLERIDRLLGEGSCQGCFDLDEVFRQGMNKGAKQQREEDADLLTIVYLDGISIGRSKERDEMMKDAVLYTKYHRTAYVLAREQLNIHGWFERERELIELLDRAKEGDKILILKNDGDRV